ADRGPDAGPAVTPLAPVPTAGGPWSLTPPRSRRPGDDAASTPTAVTSIQPTSATAAERTPAIVAQCQSSGASASATPAASAATTAPTAPRASRSASAAARPTETAPKRVENRFMRRATDPSGSCAHTHPTIV